MLADNINILKLTYPRTWQKLKSLEDSLDMDSIQIEETKKGGYKTLWVEKNNKKSIPS